MKPELTEDGRPIEDIDPHEFDPMVADTLSQFENLRNNETVDRDVTLNDYEGTD